MARATMAAAAAATIGLVLSGPAAAQDVATVISETQFCADLGRKQPGEPADLAMADHIAERFAAAGLEVERQEFHLPVFELHDSVIEVVTPEAKSYEGAAFAYSGTGTVEAEVVYVGVGREGDYAGVDADGKIVMVDRELTFHRSAQLNEVEAHGGAAMLYVSAAPDNLVQVGTVRFAQHPPALIPTLTVGQDDGNELKALIGGGVLVMRLSVDATIKDAVGVNVLGTKVGTTYPEVVIVVGGHYDSWYAGAVDNCSAIGSMLQMVEQVADRDLAYTVVFGAWDAEEVGLVGSYDFVMKNPELLERVVLNQNLEMTSAATQLGSAEAPASLVNLIFGTTGPALNATIAESMARTGHVGVPTTASGVRSVQGGIIPTDLQPFYTAGVQGFSTFSNSAYYHTHDDTTDHIPAGSHEAVTEFLTAFLLDVQNVPPMALRLREVPTVEVEVPETVALGNDVEVVVQVTDPAGRPLSGEAVRVLVNERDHWPVTIGPATDNGDGTYAFTVPADLVRPAQVLWFTAEVQNDLYAAEGYASAAVLGAPPTPVAPPAPAPPPSPLPVTGGGLAALGAVGVAAAIVRRRRSGHAVDPGII